jgi:hypothetical protein
MLVISLRLGIPRNPEHLLPGTSFTFEYMKQGKYISGDERGGYKVAKVNLCNTLKFHHQINVSNMVFRFYFLRIN